MKFVILIKEVTNIPFIMPLPCNPTKDDWVNGDSLRNKDVKVKKKLGGIQLGVDAGSGL